MKEMYIYESALINGAGWSNNQNEKERISLLVDKINSNQASVIRYNLTTSPQEFALNKKVDMLLNSKGLDVLPIIMVDDEVKMTGKYPSDKELIKLLGI